MNGKTLAYSVELPFCYKELLKKIYDENKDSWPNEALSKLIELSNLHPILEEKRNELILPV